MEEYKKYLKSKKVVELKNIARSYIKHIKFAFTGVKKGELINHLLKHTMLEDGKIKVIDSDVPVKVLIKGKDEDIVRKQIETSEMKMIERDRLGRLLYGQKGGFLGRIQRFKSERDELIKEDNDNLKKKHTKAIEDYNKQIEETQKQLKVVNALIKDFENKVEEKVNERKVMKEQPKKEDDTYIEMNVGETKEQAIQRGIKETKDLQERQKASLLNLFKTFSNKDDWKKATMKEKELLCSNFSLFQKMNLDIPKHLSDYHKRWCKKNVMKK